jgi:hypothetical protein
MFAMRSQDGRSRGASERRDDLRGAWMYVPYGARAVVAHRMERAVFCGESILAAPGASIA